MRERAIFRVLPELAARIPWIGLGSFPTPVEPLAIAPDVWIKRDDLSGEPYGGNKLRPLEPILAAAAASGARRIWAVGAFGSNHALATALLAAESGLQAGAILFPQPPSEPARANLVATLGARPALRVLPSVVAVPFAMLATARRPGEVVMPPGGATVLGMLAYVSAGLELAEQVAAGAMPPPARIVVGVGSGATTAGLLVGLELAARLGIGWRERPHVVAVRVTPWPVTARARLVSLARRTAARLAGLGGERALVDLPALGRRLDVVGRELGRGYGHPTPTGLAAIERFRTAAAPPLDTVYTAKSAAGLLAELGREPSPTLFWMTKSSRPLPPVDDEALAEAPPRLRRWLARSLREPSPGVAQATERPRG